MKTFILNFSILLFFSFSTFAQDFSLAQWYDAKGKATDFNQVVAAAQEADIVFFGEYHNNTVHHWYQFKLTEALQASGKPLMLGAEMFESDQQLLMTEYVQGLITDKQFEDESRLWNNYKTDYKPLVKLAVRHQIPFIATNVPRRYASMVSKQGPEYLQSLSSEAKQWIAPLPYKIPYELPSYADMGKMMGGHGDEASIKRMVAAQAIKDATMAHFILKNWKPGTTFLHYNGSYHSNKGEGIVWYLLQQNPKLKIIVISAVEQKELRSLEEANTGLGAYILVTPDDVMKSY